MTVDWYGDYSNPKQTTFDTYSNIKKKQAEKKEQQKKDAEALQKSSTDWDAVTKGKSLAGTIKIEQTKVDRWTDAFGRNEDGFRIWNGNSEAIAISFFGGGTGSALGSSRYGGQPGVEAGSPQTFDEALDEILKTSSKEEGGIQKLKEALYEKNYLSGDYARKSLALGDQEDQYLYNALGRAILDGTNYNISRAQKGAKSFLTFKDWLKITPKVSADGDGPGGGSGGTQTSIVQQTFSPEDYDIAIDQLFQKTVGRGASKEELDFFVSQLQNYSNANPETTVRKTTGNTTTTTRTGGVSAERAASMMREQALNTPGAEEYNKATKYLNYFTDAINSPIKLG